MSTACLASSLCARFVAPRPCTMLESTHNAGRNLSCAVPWSRYATFTSSVHGKAPTHAHAGRPLLLDAPTAEPAFGRPVTIDSKLPLYYALQTAHAAVRAGKRFVWHLDWPDDQSAPVDGAAQLWLAQSGSPARVAPSTLVVSLRDAFYRRVGIAGASTYTTLHVRRGDALKQCDTSLAKVFAYANCSLSNLGRIGLAEDLVLFTDESDAGYVDALVSALRSLSDGSAGGARARRVYHGDAALRELAAGLLPGPLAEADSFDLNRPAAESPANTADNYLIFAAAHLIQEDAATSLEMRDQWHQSTCLECYLRDARGLAAAAANPQQVHAVDKMSDWTCTGAYPIEKALALAQKAPATVETE